MPLEVLDHLLLQPLRSQLHFLVEAWVVKHVDDGLPLYLSLSKTKTQNMQPGTTGEITGVTEGNILCGFT
jgi:hypothetical protein